MSIVLYSKEPHISPHWLHQTLPTSLNLITKTSLNSLPVNRYQCQFNQTFLEIERLTYWSLCPTGDNTELSHEATSPDDVIRTEAPEDSNAESQHSLVAEIMVSGTTCAFSQTAPVLTASILKIRRSVLALPNTVLGKSAAAQPQTRIFLF